MPSLRRLLVRSLLAPLLLLPLLSCGYPKPTPKVVAAALAHSSTFVEPKSVITPPRVEANTDASMGGGALADRQLAKIHRVLAILHANKLVDIQDVYGPDGGSGGYFHILTIAPASTASPDLFIETNEPAPQPPFWATKVRETPGWRVTLGRREIIKVWRGVHSSSPPPDRLSPRHGLARVDFPSIPTHIASLFHPR